MLLEPGSEASLGLSDVDLSTRAWYLVHGVRLLLDGERVFDLSEHGPESRARPKDHFDMVFRSGPTLICQRNSVLVLTHFS